MKKIFQFVKRLLFKQPPIIKNVMPANIITLAPNELLKGRTALITGCTSGIGLSIAKAFLNAGASVVAIGRNPDKLEKTVSELLHLTNDESKVFSYVLDVTETEKFEIALNEIIKLIPSHKIDILINNAGLGNLSSLTEAENYDIVMNTNLKAVYFLTRCVARHMIEDKIEGNILNIASSSSLRPASTVYGMSKWGVRGLTEGFAKMLLPYNIIVNGIGPGLTATPFAGKTNNDDIYNPSNPSKRLVTPEEVANLAVVLTSGMGRMIVGDIVYISGGAGVITCDDIGYEFN